ncbi:MAG: ABC transporter ATP-binding protein [Campylobacterales bacterium]|nr:ABC transporter ATP-binding protein [Campylobacterales bacterium]
MSDNIIEVRDLSFSYGRKTIYKDLSFNIKEGSVFGLLGKNGVGKSTLINTLMGYNIPQSGSCKILGEESSSLSSTTKDKIGLLHEGFISYDFLSIKEIEEFFAPFYKKWRKDLFYDLVDLMELDYSQKLNTLSFGQKSQVVLGLIFGQDPEILILDDYSMGLDAGYRRLFIEYLKDFIDGNKKTVLITSHVMDDLEHLVDEIGIVQKGEEVYLSSMKEFTKSFRCYQGENSLHLEKSFYQRLEKQKNRTLYYSFLDKETIERENNCSLTELECSFEDKFLGFVGKY